MRRNRRDRKAGPEEIREGARRSEATAPGEAPRASDRNHRRSSERSNGPGRGERVRGTRSGSTRSARRDERFVLYVEGPRDREILETWARRLEPAVARCIEARTVILGGRQPVRALEDFRKRGGHASGWRGLVVLDRDHHDEVEGGDSAPEDLAAEPGLELFVWGLRHIESYLLVPSAIRRLVTGLEVAEQLEALLARELDGGPSLHAKRFLGTGGSLSEALGMDLRAGEIARAMRADELHVDVRTLLTRIGSLSGVAMPPPEVVIRRS